MYPTINLSATTPSLKQRVYDCLLQHIVSGELPPGTHLMEAEIAQAMCISRAPIREALNMLERDGFTRSIPHRGSEVAEVTMQNVHEFWEARYVLEPYMAMTSFQAIPKEHLQAVAETLDELEKCPEQYDKFMESDTEVHEMLFTYHTNEYLKGVIRKLHAHSQRMRWITDRQQNSPEDCLISIHEHQEIVRALLAGEPDRIYHTVQTHQIKSQQRLLQAIAANESNQDA